MSDTPGLGISNPDMFDPHTAEQVEKFVQDQAALTGDEFRALVAERQRHYKAVFGNADSASVRFVLEDLAFFTRAHSSAFNPDPRLHALIEGRREVYYRIADNTQLPRDLLYERYVAADIERNRTK